MERPPKNFIMTKFTIIDKNKTITNFFVKTLNFIQLEFGPNAIKRKGMIIGAILNYKMVVRLIFCCLKEPQ